MREFKNRRNPVLPLEYHIPDSEAHVMPDGKLYVYGSFDDREKAYCSEKYYVISTKDMEHWEIHDVSFEGKQVPWHGDPEAPKYPGIDWSNPTPFIRKMMEKDRKEQKEQGLEEPEEKRKQAEIPPFLYAPDCIHRNGKYYLYFCMPDDSEGVAVSAYPEGPFNEPKQLPCGGIDPAVFIDDDGQAYYYWGQLFSHGVKLQKDMVSFEPESRVDNLVTEEEHFFHEGSSMRKIGDTYYYVYADMERGKPTSLGYSTGKSPLGPFSYQGIIIDNDGCDPASWNNHGSIECLNGQWYVFYHRCSRNSQVHRRLCIEPVTIRPDGTIPEVKMTSQGTGAPFAPGEGMMGYQACGVKGSVYIGLDQEFGYEEKLTGFSAGDEAVFRYVKSEEKWNKIMVTYTGSGKLQVLMNGKEAGMIHLDAGKKQDCVATTEGMIQMEAGEYELILKAEEADELDVFEIVLF